MKDKFRLEMRHSTNEGKTTAEIRDSDRFVGNSQGGITSGLRVIRKRKKKRVPTE